MKIDAARIKSWVERIENLLEQRAGLNSDIKDIYAEIKSGDHDAKAIRKLIQRRAQDEGELAEQDALLAAYTDAIAGKIKALEAIRAGASTEEAAKAGGISTGAVSVLRQGEPVQKSQKLNKTQSETAVSDPPGSGTGTADTSSPAPAAADDLTPPPHLERRRAMVTA
jgi:uncharacterized protein (UPF0335 family)